MDKKVKGRFIYVLIAITFMFLVFGSLSTLISARRIAEDYSSAASIHNAYIASMAGVEVARSHIESNRIIESGSMPTVFHLNGALFDVEWSDPNPTDLSVRILSRGWVLSDDMPVLKSEIDTTVTLNYQNPSDLTAADYFGG